jgi:hypothetical protein
MKIMASANTAIRAALKGEHHYVIALPAAYNALQSRLAQGTRNVYTISAAPTPCGKISLVRLAGAEGDEIVDNVFEVLRPIFSSHAGNILNRRGLRIEQPDADLCVDFAKSGKTSGVTYHSDEAEESHCMATLILGDSVFVYDYKSLTQEESVLFKAVMDYLVEQWYADNEVEQL